MNGIIKIRLKFNREIEYQSALMEILAIKQFLMGTPKIGIFSQMALGQTIIAKMAPGRTYFHKWPRKGAICYHFSHFLK